jgi:hypothetical protein
MKSIIQHEIKDEYDNDGKVYELEFNGKFYIGTTRNSVRTRYTEHKQNYIRWKDDKKCYSNVCSSKELFELSENNEINYRVIKYFDIITNRDLIEREREIIISYKEKYGDNCVNINLTKNKNTDRYRLKTKRDKQPKKTKEEIRLWGKKYRETHPQERKKWREEYKASGRERELSKIWYENNREKSIEAQKKWNEENRELILELRQTKKDWNLSFKVDATKWGMTNNLLHIKL